MGMLRSISFALASCLYSIIPDLYNLFEKIASTEFFTAESIQEISNNIYILVSICMLFAFGIKLISTIVNPDLIDDKKKGPGKTFVNAILAVILITVTPMAFNFLYKAQTSLLNSHIIEKVIFGMDPDSNIKTGNVLAAYTFRAFCYPRPQDDSTTISVSGSPSARNYNKAIAGDMTALDSFSDDINNKTDGEYDFQYHILLSPLAAGYVAYELFLMTIDIAFRSIKLGLLQLIAPLVIVGFIFSGTDLLMRWVKEVISTFVLVFVKLAAMIFIIYGMSKFDDFVTAADVQDSIWLTGFIRVIILIALLQLIKKIPDIINKIFGTDIKMSGGLGDRLSEMAGIGGLAKSALDKVKATTGKVLGKAGKIAGVGAAALAFPGAGALAAGLGAGAGVGVHAWRRGINGHGPLKDTKGGRGLRRVGAVGHGVWKGLTSDGGVVKGIQAGIKDYGETEIGKQSQTERLQRRQDERSRRFRDNINKVASEKYGATGNVVDIEDGRLVFKDAKLGQKALQDVIANDGSLTARQRENAANYFKQNGILATLNELKGQKEKILSEIANSQASLDKTAPDYQKRYDALEQLKGHILNGGRSAVELHDDIKAMLDGGVITSLSAQNMGTGLRKILSAVANSDLGQDLKDSFTTQNGLDLSNGKLLTAISDQTTAANSAKVDYDQSKEGATAAAKETLGRYESTSENINSRAIYSEQTANEETRKLQDMSTYYDGSSTAPRPGSHDFIGPMPAPVTPVGESGDGGSGSGGTGGTMNGTTINGATINVTNLNAQNVNASNLNGNLGQNRVDTSDLTGDLDANLSDDAVRKIADAVNAGVSSADYERASANADANWANQQTDNTYENGGFNISNPRNPDSDPANNEPDYFDQFWDDDE